MVHYVDDEAQSSNETLCRSMLNLIALCRMSAQRLKLDDESARREIVDALAQAQIVAQRLLAQEQGAKAQER